MPTIDWSEVPNLGITDGGQCVIYAPPDGGQCTPIFESIAECKFSSGACFSFHIDLPKEREMALPAGFPPPVAKPAKAKAVHAAPDMAEAVEAPTVPSVPSVPSVPLPGAVGIPSAGAFGELGQLPNAANISPLTIILALVAVGGGGAAWKFYSQRSREKHEEQMLKIEKGDSGNDQQRQKCDAAAQWAKEKVESLSVRADATDKNVSASLEGLDKRLAAVEDLETRLSALERKSAANRKAPDKKTKGAPK